MVELDLLVYALNDLLWKLAVISARALINSAGSWAAYGSVLPGCYKF